MTELDPAEITSPATGMPKHAALRSLHTGSHGNLPGAETTAAVAHPHRSGSDHAGLRVRDYAGFRVCATDGWAGHVDKGSHREYNGDLVVDTGHAFFKHKVVVPVDAIIAVDPNRHVLRVDLTRAEVKSGPSR